MAEQSEGVPADRDEQIERIEEERELNGIRHEEAEAYARTLVNKQQGLAEATLSPESSEQDDAPAAKNT